MKLIIDAWLERRDPHVTLRNGDGECIARWRGGGTVAALLDAAGLGCADLAGPLDDETSAGLIAALARGPAPV